MSREQKLQVGACDLVIFHRQEHLRNCSGSLKVAEISCEMGLLPAKRHGYDYDTSKETGCVCVCVYVMCADSTAQELCREEGKEFSGTSNLAPDKLV